MIGRRALQQHSAMQHHTKRKRPRIDAPCLAQYAEALPATTIATSSQMEGTLMREEQRLAVNRLLAARRHANSVFGLDVCDNHTWREISVIDRVNRLLGLGLYHQGGRQGPDATCSRRGWTNVSIKTSTFISHRLTSCSGRIEFQRQNDKKHRDAVLNGFQALIFALFRKNRDDPVLTVVLQEPLALETFRNILCIKQTKFMSLPQRRDSVQVRFDEIFRALKESNAPYDIILFEKKITNHAEFFEKLGTTGFLCAELEDDDKEMQADGATNDDDDNNNAFDIVAHEEQSYADCEYKDQDSPDYSIANNMCDIQEDISFNSDDIQFNSDDIIQFDVPQDLFFNSDDNIIRFEHHKTFAFAGSEN